jgi:hypothetical protein
MITAAPTAVEILQRLSVDELRKRLAENEAEREAILVLLRAARAAERRRNRQPAEAAR